MKKFLFLFSSVIFLLTGCGEDKGYYLSGDVKGVENGTKIYISELDGKTRSPKAVDTAVVQDEKFELDMEEMDLPALSFLRIEGVNGNLVFIAENEKLKFNINKDSIRSSRVSGGQENEALYEYLDHMKEMNRKIGKMQKEARTAMIQKDTAKLKSLQATETELKDNDRKAKEEIFSRNTDTFLAVTLLADMLSSKSHSSKEVRDMFSEVSDRIKQTDMAKDLKSELEKMKNAEMGSKAPDFEAPTPDGEMLALSDRMGQVTVVDFWAAWCKPCRIENPNLVKTYNKYKDQGLNIISVSLDRPGQKDRWVQAIKDDKLEQWDHVSNLQFWQDPVARLYGITAIPATYILDKDGIIVAKNLRGDALAEKIGELLN